MDIKVARVIDNFTLVLNKGAADGVKEGQRFLVYGTGEVIADPDTGDSLGRLEIVRGTGKVTHLQEKMATIGSDMSSDPSRTVRKTQQNAPSWLSAMARGLSTSQEIELRPPQKVPFENAAVGDAAKPI